MKKIFILVILLLGATLAGCGQTALNLNQGNVDQNLNQPAVNQVAPAPTSEPAPTPAPTPKPAPTVKIFTSQEVARHNTAGDCWLIVGSKVYDATSYLGSHPAGPGKIISYCGQNATQVFSGHSSQASSLLGGLFIGDLNLN